MIPLRCHSFSPLVPILALLLSGLLFSSCNLGFEKVPLSSAQDTRTDAVDVQDQSQDLPEDVDDCTAGTTACDDSGEQVCVDTLMNPQHCGGCNQACGEGEACADGMCCSLPVCPDFPLECGAISNQCGLSMCTCQSPWSCGPDGLCDVAADGRPFEVLDSATANCVDGQAEPAGCPNTGGLALQDGALLSGAPQLITVESQGVVAEQSNGFLFTQSIQEMNAGYDIAVAACEELTLAGYGDWRLPAVMELHSLVDMGSLQAFDQGVLPWGTFELWVKSSADVDGQHRVIGPKGRLLAADTASVVCVRGPDYADAVVSTSGEVLEHSSSGLVFTAPRAQAGWVAALTDCADLELEGLDDWRLPTVKELILLIDVETNTDGPWGHEGVAFVNERVFTSTPFPGIPEIVVVDFGRGTVGEEGPGAPHRYSCVRGP